MNFNYIYKDCISCSKVADSCEFGDELSTVQQTLSIIPSALTQPLYSTSC